MKIRINLLPENRKILARNKKRFKSIIEQEILFILPVVVFIFMLIGINLVLKVQNSSIDISNKMLGDQEGYKDMKSYEEKANFINTKVLDIRKIKESTMSWSGVINEMINVMPEGISLSNLSTADYKITLIGKANNRETLIAFKNLILESSCFENANVPLSNLVVKENVNFEMDFDVKKECLLKKTK